MCSWQADAVARSNSFQYSVGDARTLPYADVVFYLASFNTPLEMPVCGVGAVFRNTRQAFNTPLEMQGARAGGGPAWQQNTFNTPLEMRSSLAISSLASSACFFQYSVGDATSC